MKLISIALAALACFTANLAAAIVDTHFLDDLARVRAFRETTASNAELRQSMLYSWYRLLLNQGLDLRAFDDVRRRIGRGALTPEKYKLIDEAYRVLGETQFKPYPEHRGDPTPGEHRPSDWPTLHGNFQHTGHHYNAGPTEGRVAWKFPAGHAWYARPTIRDGVVYAASPGLTTAAYAFDELTGRMIWKARVPGVNLYRDPRVSSGVVVLKDSVVVRESGSGGPHGKAKDLVYMNRKTGSVMREVTAGHVDYRRGYAPVSGDDRYLVYPHSHTHIQHRPPIASMLNTVVVKDTESGETLWSFRSGDIFGDVVLHGDQVLVASDQGILYCLNIRGPQRVAWSYSAGAPLRTTPIVKGDTVYAAAENGRLYAVSIENGELRWERFLSRRHPGAFQHFSTPTADGRHIYIGDARGYLYCLQSYDGEPAWRMELSDWIRSRPAVEGGRVYVATMDGNLTAIATDGEPLWVRKVSDHQILADLVASENGVLITTSDLYLYSCGLKGSFQWQASLLESATIDGEVVRADVVGGGADYQSSPTAVDGTVFIGTPSRFVFAVDAISGDEKWRFEASGQVSAAPTYSSGTLFFGQQGGNKDFYNVDAETGELRWSKPLGWAWTTAVAGQKIVVATVEGTIHSIGYKQEFTHQTNGGVYPAPAIDGDSVYTGSWDGYFYALDSATGKPRWSYFLGGAPDSAAPVLSNGKVYIQALGRHFDALDVRTGTSVWKFDVPEGYNLNATPAAVRDRVYMSIFLDANGAPSGARLIALDEKTGAAVWEYRPGGGLTGPVVGRDRVYIGSTMDNYFSSVDANSGELVWRTRIGGLIEESCAALYGKRAYVLVNDGYLYAFE